MNPVPAKGAHEDTRILPSVPLRVLLRLKDVSFGYSPHRKVLTDVSAEFAGGTLTAVLGPNGAGKSTLLRILLGIVRPQRGLVSLDDRPLAAIARSHLATRVAYIAQRGEVAFAFTVREVVGLGRYGRPGTDAAGSSAIREVGLADRENDMFAELSVGQQQRVSVARSIVQLDGRDPATTAILADEPVAAMDPPHALSTMTLLADRARRGAAVVVVLHDLYLAGAFASHLVILGADGRVQAQGPAAQVLEPATLERAFDVPFHMLGSMQGPFAFVPLPGCKSRDQQRE